jgi:hypothetical protein
MNWFTGFSSKVAGYFKEIGASVWAVAEWIVNSVVWFFWSVVDYVIKMVWGFCYYLYDLFLGENGFIWYGFDFICNQCEWALSEFPDLSEFLDTPLGASRAAAAASPQSVFSTVMQLIGRFNQFFPLTECGILILLFLLFLLVFLLFKYMLEIMQAMPKGGG